MKQGFSEFPVSQPFFSLLNRNCQASTYPQGKRRPTPCGKIQAFYALTGVSALDFAASADEKTKTVCGGKALRCAVGGSEDRKITDALKSVRGDLRAGRRDIDVL